MKFIALYNTNDNSLEGVFESLELAKEEAFDMFCNQEMVEIGTRWLIDREIVEQQHCWEYKEIGVLEIESLLLNQPKDVEENWR